MGHWRCSQTGKMPMGVITETKTEEEKDERDLKSMKLIKKRFCAGLCALYIYIYYFEVYLLVLRPLMRPLYIYIVFEKAF